MSGCLNIHKDEVCVAKSFFQVASEPIISSTKKVSIFVISFLSLIKNIFCFPLRYLGAKNWSIPGVVTRLPFVLFRRVFGYSQGESFTSSLFGKGYTFFYQLMPKAQVSSILPYAFFCAFVHSMKKDWIDPLRYQVISPNTLGVNLRDLEAHESCFFDPKTALKIVIFEKGEEVVFAFGAVRCGDSELSNDEEKTQLFYLGLKDVLLSWFGGSPEIYFEAENAFKEISKLPRFKGKKITFVGQCLGGALASYVGLKQKIPTYCFNTLPFGAGMQKAIGKENLDNAEQYVTHLKVEKDFLTSRGIYHFSDRVLTGIGIRTPGSFGKKFFIPTAYSKGKDTHDYAFGSMLHYLGYDKKAKPKDIYK